MRWSKYVLAGASAVAVALIVRLVSNHVRIAAPLLMLDVIFVARFLGFGAALFTAFSAAAGYWYLFLGPRGFGIQSPDDGFALGTFLIAAVIAGELAARAERRTTE